MLDLDSINTGFSRKALVYDAYGAENLAVQWTRAQVRARVLELAGRMQAERSGGKVSAAQPKKINILELNAGTGEDAAYLAAHGLRVHATDLADGMVAELQHKAERNAFTAQKLSFLELENVPGGPFDLVFSNFGGLNCAPLIELRGLTQKLPSVLTPDGALVWVLMPPVCPWELAQAARGHFSVAFRRLRGHTRAHVEGAYFSTFYFQPAPIIQLLQPNFASFTLHALSLFSPPAFMEGFPRRWPRLFHTLTQLDARVCGWPGLNSMGDFFILTARRR